MGSFKQIKFIYRVLGVVAFALYIFAILALCSYDPIHGINARFGDSFKDLVLNFLTAVALLIAAGTSTLTAVILWIYTKCASGMHKISEPDKKE